MGTYLSIAANPDMVVFRNAKRREQPLDTSLALDKFLASIERRALRMAEIAAGNTDDALDLVQEAMLKFVEHYADKPSEEWGPLFYRTLQNCTRDRHRRVAVRNRFFAWMDKAKEQEHEEGDEDTLHNIADPGAMDPIQWTQQQRTIQALEEALHSLPLRQQQVFLLRVWEGLDVGQTAFAMGCSEGSVKTHYSRAVHTLRRLLEDHWP